MTASAIAQIIMVATLLLMITGKTPIYITAITGATIAALVAGFPIAGSADMTIAKMVISGLNPVIADMTGILLFIGIMQATGFMDVIIRDIVRVGNKLGGGTGVCTAGGIAAGVIGALTGFTQPVITAVITARQRCVSVWIPISAPVSAHTPVTSATSPVSPIPRRWPSLPRPASASGFLMSSALLPVW